MLSSNIAENLLEINKFSFYDYCQKDQGVTLEYTIPPKESGWYYNNLKIWDHCYMTMELNFCESLYDSFMPWRRELKIILDTFDDIKQGTFIDKFRKEYNDGTYEYNELNYIAIIYIDTILKLMKRPKFLSHLPDVQTPDIMIYNGEIINEAKKIIEEILNSFLIKDLIKIINDYIASGNDIIYI